MKRVQWALSLTVSPGKTACTLKPGKWSALSAGANFGADQVTMEARNYGLARHYDPFLVNTVVGFIGPEYSTTTVRLFARLGRSLHGQAERHLNGLRLLLHQPC
jgi:ethanolamine ammonia-lyase large subunit